MSLQFVTKKLEGHTLDEALNNLKDKQVEDSGTESDDETEPEAGLQHRDHNTPHKQHRHPPRVVGAGTDSSGGRRSSSRLDRRQLQPKLAATVGNAVDVASAPSSGEDNSENTDSGGCLSQSSAGQSNVHTEARRVGPALLQHHHPLSPVTPDLPSPGSSSGNNMAACGVALDNDQDQHSSEEELEDIIGDHHRRKLYVNSGGDNHMVGSSVAGVAMATSHTPTIVGSVERAAAAAAAAIALDDSAVITAAATAAAAIAVTATTAVRAGSAVEKRKWSEVDKTNCHIATRTGSGSSGDEEVSGYMGCSYTPVQFCTSPPLNVYKPRRSQSPPPKLFHLASNGTGAGAAGTGGQDPPNIYPLRETQMLSGAFRPRVRGSGLLVTRSRSRGYTAAPDDEEEGEEDLSPSKKHRTTPRPHTIQRPCLDFEKMQQIKTKVVTSWRQGTELSLFCW